VEGSQIVRKIVPCHFQLESAKGRLRQKEENWRFGEKNACYGRKTSQTWKQSCKKKRNIKNGWRIQRRRKDFAANREFRFSNKLVRKGKGSSRVGKPSKQSKHKGGAEIDRCEPRLDEIDKHPGTIVPFQKRPEKKAGCKKKRRGGGYRQKSTRPPH